MFRLCVEDYHRYIYVDDGVKSENVKIPGVLHTVNPVANDSFPIYKENAREFSLLCSENFGTVLMMEVGAMMVGKLKIAIRRQECEEVRKKEILHLEVLRSFCSHKRKGNAGSGYLGEFSEWD